MFLISFFCLEMSSFRDLVIERPSLIVYFCLLSCRLIGCKCTWVNFTPYSCSIDLCINFCAITTLLWQWYFWSRGSKIPPILFLIQIALDIWDLLNKLIQCSTNNVWQYSIILFRKFEKYRISNNNKHTIFFKGLHNSSLFLDYH